ncbi:LysR substrate-binding domain-containing protein [Hydrogenophaga sp.]|jgi:DNA-binding transcriptional LysR family regulator|uniref:LysR substrate-binding domain-containing protein n=1 Tax=Hydrogenophaga sp. TaxID=1904254 RepID=UPI003F71869C
MRDLDLKTLRLLVAVCDLGNMKDAAAQEHIEPSAISKRIAQLEDVIGTPVLVRGRRGAEPTPAGRALLEHARNVLFTMDRIEADMASFKGGIKGQVRLVASASAIAESLLDDLAGFMREPAHQDIQVDIEERFSRDIVGMVREGVVSLGVCWSNIDFGGLESRPYRRDELALAVPLGHPLARRESVHFEETLDHDHVGLPPSTAVHTMLHRAAVRAGKTMRYRVVVSNFDSAFRVVGAGLGVSVVPREVSQIYVSAGQVRIVPLQNDWAHRQFAICFRRHGDLTPAAERLLDFLCQQARDAAPTPA